MMEKNLAYGMILITNTIGLKPSFEIFDKKVPIFRN